MKRPLSQILRKVMLSPWMILGASGLGIAMGILRPDLAAAVEPAGKLYLRLLEMCVLPILISAIALNVGRILSARGEGTRIGRLAAFTLAFFLAAGALGVAGGMIGQPGKLDAASRGVLGNVVQQSGFAPDLEIAMDTPYVEKEQKSAVYSFLERMVPQNVFEALSSGSNLKVLFFAILFGLALGFVSDRQAATVFEALDAIYRAFSTLIMWSTYALPFALPCMIAPQVQSAGPDVIAVMTRFLGVETAVFFIACVLSAVIVWRRSGGAAAAALKSLKEPIALAFGTGNSLACVPSALDALGRLGFGQRDIGLVVPLGITVFRFGNIAYFAVATLFIAQVYGQSPGVSDLAFVVIGCVLAGMATGGTSGVLTLVMLDIVLVPLQLPLAGILPLFIVLEPVMTPFRTIVNVVVNCALAAQWAERETEAAEIRPVAVPSGV